MILGLLCNMNKLLLPMSKNINKREKKMTIISLKNVNLTRNKTEILKNITWQVNQGENWVILGLNGSGKSSLLKLILAEEEKLRPIKSIRD